MKWIKGSERLPDLPEHWLATSETQEGKVVHCKVNDQLGIGYFYRVKGKMYFTYQTFEQEYNYVLYENLDELEWLDESEATDKEKEIGDLKMVFDIMVGNDSRQAAEIERLNHIIKVWKWV